MGGILLLLLLSYPAHGFDTYNRVVKYDRYFAKYSKRFFGPLFDWRHFKAQAIAESRLDANATSRVGAVGIMQIMPRTYREIVRQSAAIHGPHQHPRWNIAAGIYYDRKMWQLWQAKRPFQDRLNFMFGSFNAGKGTILRAQKYARQRGLNENLWVSIERSLPAVTGKRSKETITYVHKIQTIKKVLH